MDKPLLLIFPLAFLLFACQSEKAKTKSTQTVEEKISTPKTPSYPIDTIPDDTFSEIPALEAQFKKQQNQPAKQKISLDFPLSTHRHVLEKNQFMFKIKGRWIGKQKPPTQLKVKFFSNQIADFTNEKPLHEWEVSLKETAAGSTFRVSQIMLNRWTGLYYYVIESLDGKEQFFIGKTELL